MSVVTIRGFHTTLKTLLAGAAVLCASLAAASDFGCKIGAYAGPDGDFVTIIKRPTAPELRYYFRDGRFGRPGDGTVACAKGAVLVETAGKRAQWNELALRLTPTRFQSDGVILEGLLLEPVGEASKRPLVVLVHGSENNGSIEQNPYPYVFAAQGISAFVYDKRGTGRSGGKYTQNFHRLAADTVAASKEAKRLAGGRFSAFGLFGGSQGGWVAPRAAPDAGASFVAIGFGLLVNPLEEDALQVATELGALGYADDVLGQARQVTTATGDLVAAHFEQGYEKLDAVRRQYGSEPWFNQIRGEFTGGILALSEAELRRDGRTKFDNLDIDWRYDALTHLRAVRVPQLWVIAEEDREAPPSVTIDRLEALRAEGLPISVARFPKTDHGMVEFREAPDGSRTPLRITDGYFRLIGDWILRRSRPPYGEATLTPEGPPVSRPRA